MKHLIIGSGAMMIYMFLGAMQGLSQSNILDDVQEISCASCGSLIGYFFVLFFGDMEKVTHIAFDQDMKQFAKPDIKTFLKKITLYSNKDERIVESNKVRLIIKF